MVNKNQSAEILKHKYQNVQTFVTHFRSHNDTKTEHQANTYVNHYETHCNIHNNILIDSLKAHLVQVASDNNAKR